MFKLNSWRLADVLTMALLAMPLVGCSDAVGNSRQAQQSRSLSHPVSQRIDEGDKETAIIEGIAPDYPLRQTELRHFHVYQNYHAAANVTDKAARQSEGADDDPRVERAVLSFSERDMKRALSDCSLRAMLMLD